MTQPVGELADADARRRIREDLDTTLFVEAAAGTGKTTELVSRIVAILCSGRGTLDRIVAVTFTDKAAGEMKLRLRGEIERARAELAGLRGGSGEATLVSQRLDAALSQLEVARIVTLHAFCADLLHERPVEAGVDPLFAVAPDDQARLADRAFDEWFQDVLEDPPEGVRRVLRRMPQGLNAIGPRVQLRNAAQGLIEHRDFDAAWRREPFDRVAEIDRVFERLVEIGSLAQSATNAKSYLAQSLQEIHRFTHEVLRRERAAESLASGDRAEGRSRDHDRLESELRNFARPRFRRHWNWKGSGNLYAPDLPRADVLARRDAVKAELDALVEACDADLAPRLHAELQPVVRSYEAHKDRVGQLDFLDLLVRTRDLLRTDPVVREGLQQRFTHFFIDEFQDTDPLQAEILLLLCADDPVEDDYRKVTPRPGKLFLVGDPKQSIYRFRRADVGLYESIKRRLVDSGAALVYLTTSFRSVPSIQSLVNGAFAVAMAPQGDARAQADYVALQAFRSEPDTQPAVVALPVPRPYVDWGNRAQVTNREIEASFPDAVAAFVHWLVSESGWTVAERGDSASNSAEEPERRVPIAARHICLLFRRFRQFDQDATRPYVRGLEARRIPHVLVGGRSFHDREEVLAIRNALFAIEWPDDRLRVFATLRGPLFALGDDALLAYRHYWHQGGRATGLGPLHPLRPLSPSQQGALGQAEREVADALDVLRRLHIGRNRRPIADTVSRLLAAVRAHAGIAIWPTGEQALANCLRVIDLARRFERQGASSFRAFVEKLDEDAARGEAQEAPVVEEGTEGVRIMTVHKAKGLEFPVVILADPTCQATREPSRHVDASIGLWAERLCGCAPPQLLEARDLEARHEAEEAVRVAYVAATRARDLLVVPVVGDEQPEPEDSGRSGWLAALHDGVHPERAKRRQAQPAPGCPVGRFGEDSVLDRPRSASVGSAASVAPGRHSARVGEHSVVWWDPRALRLDPEEDVGLRQQRILEADESGEKAAEGVRAFEAWRDRRIEVRERGSVPSLRVVGVTDRTHSNTSVPESAGLAFESIESIEVALYDAVEQTNEPTNERTRSTRPGGRRFGTLVHAVLAAVELDADEARVRAAALAQARVLGSPGSEVDEAVVAVTGALAHPILRAAHEAQQAGDLRRETPVFLVLPDQTLVEGVVDLAFRTHASEPWTVVDFKTDREIPADQLAAYQAQVRLYARAIAEATGDTVRAVLLRV
jgi:ATP-dependent exoDNAse (exonuclease V) beta subunit